MLVLPGSPHSSMLMSPLWCSATLPPVILVADRTGEGVTEMKGEER